MTRELLLRQDHLESIIRLAYLQGWVDAENQAEPKAVDVRPHADTYAEELTASLFTPKPRLEVVK